MTIRPALQRRTKRLLQLGRVLGHEAGRRAELGVAPAGLDRVEFRSLSRQLLELDALEPRDGDPPGGRAMNLPASPAVDQQDPPQLVGVKRRPELLSHQRRAPRTCPQIVATPGGPQTGQQHLYQLSIFLSRQLGCPRQMRLGGQSIHSRHLPGRRPAFHAGLACAQQTSKFPQRLPCLEIPCSATPTSLQFCRTTWRSHGIPCGPSSGLGSLPVKKSTTSFAAILSHEQS